MSARFPAFRYGDQCISPCLSYPIGRSAKVTAAQARVLTYAGWCGTLQDAQREVDLKKHSGQFGFPKMGGVYLEGWTKLGTMQKNKHSNCDEVVCNVGWGRPDPRLGDGPLDASKTRLVDVGCPRGYRDFLDAMADPNHQEHAARLD
jgi:hypothetical protein